VQIVEVAPQLGAFRTRTSSSRPKIRLARTSRQEKADNSYLNAKASTRLPNLSHV
jgi:hypothetical protein